VSDSIEKVIEEYMNSEETPIFKHDMYDRLIKNIVANESRLKNLEHRYNQLLRENQKLRNEIRELKTELEKIQLDYDTYRKTLKYELAKEREIFALEERLRSCRDAYKNLESLIIGLKEENEKLRRLLLEYDEKGFIKIPILKDIKYLDTFLDKKPFNKEPPLIYVKKRIEDLKNVESILSKVGRSSIILSEKCLFKIIGSKKLNIACIDDPEIIKKLIPIDSTYILADSSIYNEIKRIYSKYLETLPRHEITSLDELVKLIESYRNSRI
jgi:predicted RNase H-like nuclease (RuvC/YqgF family)